AAEPSAIAARSHLAGRAGLGEVGEVDPPTPGAVKAPAADARAGDEDGPARLLCHAFGAVRKLASGIEVVFAPPRRQQLDPVRAARAAGLEAASLTQLAVVDAAGGDGVLHVT